MSALRPRMRQHCIGLALFVSFFAVGTGVLPVRAQQPLPEWRHVPPLCEGESSGDQRKSPALALALSAGGTAVPLVGAWSLRETRAGAFLGGAGIVFGPSLGNYYAENCRRARTGFTIRAVGVGITAVGLLYGLASFFSANRMTVRVLMGVGRATVAAGAIYDIITAPISAAEYNEAHGIRVGIAPTVGPQGTQVGLAFRVRL